MTIRIGIIGCGNIAKAHCEAYLKRDDVKITAITDISEKAIQGLSEFLGDVPSFLSIDDFFTSGLIDAVSICTPPVAHEEAALKALENNIHVLCEKPLGHTLEASQRIQEAAKNSDSQFMIAFRHRFLPAIRKMKSLIEEDKIGTPLWFRNTFCSPAFSMEGTWFSKKALAGGGTTMDTGVHSIDIFRYLFGEVLDSHVVSHRHMKTTDVEDTNIFSLKSASGVLGTCYASWVSASKIFEIDIMGQKGQLQYHYGDVIKIKMTGEDDWTEIQVQYSSGFPEEINNFIDSILGKATIEATAEDGLRAVEIAFA